MTTLRFVLALLVALVLPVAAEAFSDGCLPNSLPATPAPPVVAENVSWGFGASPDRLRFEIWRQSCLDGSGVAVLLRASPLSPGPAYFCDDNLQVIQGGHQFNTIQAKPVPTGPGFCAGIYIPSTFALQVEPAGGVQFNESQAFTLVGVGAPESFQIEIPAFGSTPSVTVQALGCTTCHPGNTLGFQVRIVNPGPPTLVELNTTARLPNGSVVTIQHGQGLLPSGVTVVPVFTGFVLPASIPPGTYIIEAVLLDPQLDEPISQDSEAFTVAP
jgi:hypothetical protein